MFAKEFESFQFIFTKNKNAAITTYLRKSCFQFLLDRNKFPVEDFILIHIWNYFVTSRPMGPSNSPNALGIRPFPVLPIRSFQTGIGMDCHCKPLCKLAIRLSLWSLDRTAVNRSAKHEASQTIKKAHTHQLSNRIGSPVSFSTIQFSFQCRCLHIPGGKTLPKSFMPPP